MVHFVYVVLGLFLGFSPLVMKIFPDFNNVRKKIDFHSIAYLKKYLIVIALITSAVFLQKNELTFGACCIILSLYISYEDKNVKWETFIISLLLFWASSRLVWWPDAFKERQSLVFLLLTLCLLKALCKSPIKKTSSLFLYFSLFAFILLAGILSFSTGLYGTFAHAIHHWAAYISTSQVLEAGGRVFYDMPTQYGLGPLALLAVIHKSNSWLEMYYFNSIMIFLYALLLMSSIIIMRNDRDYLKTIVFVISCLITTFFWTGYPHTVTFTNPYPSVNGMRFVPVVVLTLCLLLKAQGNKYFKSNIVIHIAWCFGVLWSPESAFYVTFIWWPYYLLLKYQNCTKKDLIPVILQGMATLIVCFLLLLSSFIFIYYTIYGVLPSAYTFLIYAINPPGPLPIVKDGAVWFLFAVLLLSAIALYKKFRLNPQDKETHYLFITSLLAYAVSSYFFLGRSHCNNVCNITPLILLTLVAIYSSFKTTIYRIPTIIVIITLITYGSFFGWQSLRGSLEKGTLLQFHPQQLVHDPLGSNTDIDNAINFIQSKFHEPLLVVSWNLIPYVTDDAWSGLHGFATFCYIPVEKRRAFLWNTMTRLQKTGWLIAKTRNVKPEDFAADPWLADYDTAYIRERAVDFGSYSAIRFVPRVTKK